MPQDSEPTAAGAALLSLTPGGPLDGAVTVTAIPDGRCRLEARWNERGGRRSDHVDFDALEDARIVAHEVADELRAGRVPDLTRD